jgi:hypothetical protein
VGEPAGAAGLLGAAAALVVPRPVVPTALPVPTGEASDPITSTREFPNVRIAVRSPPINVYAPGLSGVPPLTLVIV